MAYIKQSVRRAAGNPGIGIQTRDELVLIDVNDIAFMPSRNSAGVVVEDDIILKDGCYGISLYMTPGTVEVTSAADGETDQVGFTPSVKGSHPGNSREVREFKTNNVNRQFIVMVRYCSGKDTDIIGSLCNPCKLVPSYTGNKDSNTNEITFTQISKGDDIGIYLGTVPSEEPVAVVESGTAVAYVADGQYQLSAGTAAVKTISGGRNGAVITLLGVSGQAPTVQSGDGSNILLAKGEAFAATDGSQLTLRAFESGRGEYVWVEQSRHQ